MTKKRTMYFLILLLAVGLLAFVLFFSGRDSDAPAQSLQFQDRTHGITLTPYYDGEDEKYYLFLPACTSPEDITLVSSGSRVTLSDGSRTYTDTLAGAPLNRDLSLNLFPNHPPISRSCPIQLRQCTGLPALFIETRSGSLAHVNEDKHNTEEAAVTMLAGDGSLLLKQSATLSGRGNGTWRDKPKRPYNLDFADRITLGPFENLSTLCLFAEYSDESKIRNSLAYYTGQALEIPYASAYLYTNVYIDGDYAGLYGVTTKKEYTKHVREDHIQAVFELCGLTGQATFYSGFYGAPISVMYGDAENVESVVNQFESALFYQDWEGCQEYMDTESLALKYALDEFMGNFDMNYASQYYYLDENEVIHCMLPWDYDFSLGSTVRYFNDHADISILGYRDEYQYSWNPALLALPGFRQQVADQLESHFTDDLLAKLRNHLSETVSQVAPSRDCDLLRWKTSPPYNQSDLRSGLTELSEFEALFRDYFPKRRAFLMDYFRNTEDYVCIAFRRLWYGNICIPRGSHLWDYLPGAAFWDWEITDHAFLGWYTEDGRTPEDFDIVTEDLTFTARFQDLIPTETAPAPEGNPGESPETGSTPVLIILALFGLTVLALPAVWLRRLKLHGRADQ